MMLHPFKLLEFLFNVRISHHQQTIADLVSLLLVTLCHDLLPLLLLEIFDSFLMFHLFVLLIKFLGYLSIVDTVQVSLDI